MNVTNLSRAVVASLGILVGLTAFMTWLDPLDLSLVDWQGYSTDIDGKVAWDAWLAIVSGVSTCVFAAISKSWWSAGASLFLSVVGAAGLLNFVSRFSDRFEGAGELLGAGPTVATFAFIGIFAFSVLWIAAALRMYKSGWLEVLK